jgi:GntR family transcriptional regulator/MocR family aminotransferase
MIATPAFLRSALKLKMLIDLRGDAMIEGTIASLMQSGEFSRFIMKANKLYSSRCNYAAGLIGSELSHLVEFKKPQGGMALWLKFKEDDKMTGIIHKAAASGLRLIGMPYLKSEYVTNDAFRFGFASLNEQELEFAVDVLKKLAAAR